MGERGITLPDKKKLLESICGSGRMAIGSLKGTEADQDGKDPLSPFLGPPLVKSPPTHF